MSNFDGGDKDFIKGMLEQQFSLLSDYFDDKHEFVLDCQRLDRVWVALGLEDRRYTFVDHAAEAISWRERD